MATTKQAQHTPYDAEEEKFQAWLGDNGGEKAPRTPLSEWRRAWRLGGAEGYLRAKAEDADLLALLTTYVDKFDDLSLSDKQVKDWIDDAWLLEVRAAIAKAKEGA